MVKLVINSRHAMPGGGLITIATGAAVLDDSYAAAHMGMETGEYVSIAVCDTGRGMDAGVQQDLFEPFFTTKERGKGTGLGLATTFGAVNQAGGGIAVYSQPGKGTTVTLHFFRRARKVTHFIC